MADGDVLDALAVSQLSAGEHFLVEMTIIRTYKPITGITSTGPYTNDDQVVIQDYYGTTHTYTYEKPGYQSVSYTWTFTEDDATKTLTIDPIQYQLDKHLIN